MREGRGGEEGLVGKREGEGIVGWGRNGRR